ncbi:MAG: sigma 54-interacting transcriptional regulator [Thermoanaerobaculia bacterium]
MRALRLGAAGLAREGRTDCALALLEEADHLGADLADAERLETGLARARVFALAGRFAEEGAVYEALRPVALRGADERLAARFLAQEARALLDRRQYAQAAVRLEEAIGVGKDDPAERAELLLDLAATVYHAGDESRCEALLEESRRAAAAAGREDLARIARGNRVELLINRCSFDAAAAEIDDLEARAVSERDEPRRLVALHHRGRLALRRGRLDEAARANAEARALAERLGDRLEIGELWLEEGDRSLYERDFDGARRAWEAAAADPPDRCQRDRLARERLEELSWRERGGPPDAACRALAERFAADPYGAAEASARWHCLFGEAGLPAEVRERAAGVLRSGGGRALADRVFGAVPEAVAAQTVREIRDAVRAALAGESPCAKGVLSRLGIVGLAVRDAQCRELVTLGAASAPRETVWRTLEAGSARFELALWPEPSAEAAAAVSLVLETLLLRSAAEPSAAHFAAGWLRLGVVTADPSMEEPYRRLTRFAPQSVTVLILGETGSGKEAVARAVHRLSPRAAGPFVAVNVSAIPAALLESELFGHARGAFTGAERDRRGLLEEASGGTIFFDEIGDLAPPLQPKLLRALQEREIRRVGENRARGIDVRVVSATSRDLEREVEAGSFREDLYYRLHVAVLRLPALRERGRDAILLARHFLECAAREYGRGRLRLMPEAVASIGAYAWPGNVRELQNAMAQAAALGDSDGDVTIALLPDAARPPRGNGTGDYRARVDAHRRDLIADALDRAGGNRSRAARDLGLSRQALHYLMRELKVKPADSKP